MTGAGPDRDPEVAAQVAELALAARGMVDGALAGMHAGRRLDGAGEFADHRPYAPGDDLRRLDWRLWGRSERWQVRRFRAESDLGVWLVLDASASMSYVGARACAGLSKLAWARRAAAGLAWLALAQGDAAGLCVIAGGLEATVPRSTRSDHLERICAGLAAAAPRPVTDPAAALAAVAARIGGGSLVVLLSDLLCQPGALAVGLGALRAAGHDLLVLQILDEDELDLPFPGRVAFAGLEGEGAALVQPRRLRAAYAEAMAAHLAAVAQACRAIGADLHALRTAQPVGGALQAVLARRQARPPGSAR